MDKKQTPWSFPVAVEDIPETGLHIEIDAPEAVRAQLSALAGLRGLPRLSAVFDLARRGSGVRVTGRVNARVGQTCVVTLEPVDSELEESVDLKFAPQLAESIQPKADTTGLHPAEEEAPEPLSDAKVDLGAIATEFLLLGIDPYPRKAGAEFSPIKSGDSSAKPFAALEALKKRLSGG
jgi:Large ribosomal RNA subunit accumulation protein YceD